METTKQTNANWIGAQLDGVAKVGDLEVFEGEVFEGEGGPAKLDDRGRFDDVKDGPEVSASKLADARRSRRAKDKGLKARVKRACINLEIAFADLTSRTAKTVSRWMNPPPN